MVGASRHLPDQLSLLRGIHSEVHGVAGARADLHRVSIFRLALLAHRPLSEFAYSQSGPFTPDTARTRRAHRGARDGDGSCSPATRFDFGGDRRNLAERNTAEPSRP